jgi:hypothetical protein
MPMWSAHMRWNPCHGTTDASPGVLVPGVVLPWYLPRVARVQYTHWYLVVMSWKVPPNFNHLKGSGTTMPSTGSTLCAFLRLFVANGNAGVVLPLAQVVVPVIT